MQNGKPEYADSPSGGKRKGGTVTEEEEEEEETLFDPKSANVHASHYHKITAIYTHAHIWTHVHRHSS